MLASDKYLSELLQEQLEWTQFRPLIEKIPDIIKKLQTIFNRVKSNSNEEENLVNNTTMKDRMNLNTPNRFGRRRGRSIGIEYEAAGTFFTDVLLIVGWFGRVLGNLVSRSYASS
jgi:hypothetical protein